MCNIGCYVCYIGVISFDGIVKVIYVVGIRGDVDGIID